MFSLIQIIALIIALFAISRAILRFKEHKISKIEFSVWLLFWISIIIISSIPQIAGSFSDIFGFERGADILIFLALITLFYSIFRIYVKLNTIESHLTKIVREIAIKNKKKK